MNRKQRRAQQKQQGSSPANPSPAAPVAVTPSPVVDIPRLLGEALAHHRAGRLSNAEPLYRQVLGIEPRQPDALHLLGVLAHQVSRHDVAADLIGQAIAVKPDDPNFHGHLGAALRHLGRFDEAVASYDRSLALRPDHAETHNNRGMALRAAGRLGEALAAFDRALALSADYAEAATHRGAILSELGRHDAAVASFDRAIAARPDHVEAHSHRAIALMALGRTADAIASYDRTLALQPAHAAAHSNRGIALATLGRLDEALASYDRALALKPDQAEALNNRGNALGGLGRLEEALACFDRALVLKPDYPEAHTNRGNALNNLRRLAEAVASYDRALALRPHDAELHANRGVARAGQGDIEAARQDFSAALALDPASLRYAWMTSLWLPIIPPSGEVLASLRSGYLDSIGALAAMPGTLPTVETINLPSIFYLAYHGRDDREIVEALGRLYRAKAPRLGFTAPHIATWQAPGTGRRLRVGFLSEFFADHTIGRLYRGMVRHLDRRRFEVVVLHAPRAAQDTISAELDGLADKVLRLPPGLERQQHLVAGEALDALFYPDIGMSRDTYLLAYARLAPVQAVSWGHPDTTGLDTIDYFVSAAGIEPDGADAHYSERLIRLDRLPCWYEAPTVAAGTAPVRRDFGLPESGTLYACPQSLFKFHPDFDAILAAIATGDPDGHVVVLDGLQPAWSERLRTRWRESRHAAALARVHFVPRQPYDRFLALMATFDVLLDPIHFGSGNTLYEAVVHGTPIVTWPGRFMRGRIVAGAYRQMGLADAPIAERLEDYAPLALALGRDPARRAALRRAAQAKAGALFADHQAVREFEAFLAASVEAAGRNETLPAGWRPPPNLANVNL
ncbi:MAG: tetratricopeptide repeat protein [Reyranellaceae bacterium]